MIDLRAERKAKGMTQHELAVKCGVIRQTISNIECGIAKPSIRTAQQIGRILNLNWLYFFED